MTQEGQKKEKKDSQMTIISIVSLAIVLAFIIEIYEIINDPQNLVVIGALGAFILVAVYTETMLIHKLNIKKKKEQDEAYKNVYRSEKATFLLMRKYFEQMDQKMAELDQKSELPYEKLIAAQKALAKVQISRNKEHTSVMMHSNKAVLIKGNRDIIAKQEQILSGLKDLEESVRSEIMELTDTISQMKEEQNELLLDIKNQNEISRQEDNVLNQSYLDNLSEETGQENSVQSHMDMSGEDTGTVTVDKSDSVLSMPDLPSMELPDIESGLSGLDESLSATEDSEQEKQLFTEKLPEDIPMSAADPVVQSSGQNTDALSADENQLKEFSGEAIDLPPIGEELTEGLSDVSMDLPPIGEELTEGLSDVSMDLPPIGEDPTEAVSDAGMDLPPIGEDLLANSSETGMDLPSAGEDLLTGLSETSMDLPPIGEEPLSGLSDVGMDLPLIGEEASTVLSETSMDLPPIEEDSLSDLSDMSIDLPSAEEEPLSGLSDMMMDLPPIGEESLADISEEMTIPSHGDGNSMETADETSDLSLMEETMPPVDEEAHLNPADQAETDILPELTDIMPDLPVLGEEILSDSSGPLDMIENLPPIEEMSINSEEDTVAAGLPLAGEEIPSELSEMITDLPPIGEEPWTEAADPLPDLPLSESLEMDLPPIGEEPLITPMDMAMDLPPLSEETESLIKPLTEEKTIPVAEEESPQKLTGKETDLPPAARPFIKPIDMESEFPPLSKESAIESLKAKSALRKKEMLAAQAEAEKKNAEKQNAQKQDTEPEKDSLTTSPETELSEPEMVSPTVEEGLSVSDMSVAEQKDPVTGSQDTDTVSDKLPDLDTGLPAMADIETDMPDAFMEEQPNPSSEIEEMTETDHTISETSPFLNISSSELGIDSELQALIDEMELDDAGEGTDTSAANYNMSGWQPSVQKEDPGPVTEEPVIKPLGFDLSPQPLTEQSAIRKLAKSSKQDLQDQTHTITPDEVEAINAGIGNDGQLPEPLIKDLDAMNVDTLQEELETEEEAPETADDTKMQIDSGETESVPIQEKPDTEETDQIQELSEMTEAGEIQKLPEIAESVPMHMSSEMTNVMDFNTVSLSRETDIPDTDAMQQIPDERIETAEIQEEPGVMESAALWNESEMSEPAAIPEAPEMAEPVTMPQASQMTEQDLMSEAPETTEPAIIPEASQMAEAVVIPETPQMAEAVAIPEASQMIEPVAISEEPEIPEEADLMDFSVLDNDIDVTDDVNQDSPFMDMTDNKGSVSDPGHVMSADEIAALIANTDSLSDPEPIDLRANIPDFTNPGHVMSADEIEALIATM